MPPSYKPLSASTEAAPTGVFAAPPNPSFMDFEQAEALRRAQELTNQMNELKAQQMQQQFEASKQFGQAVQQQFGAQPDGSTPEFDPNAVLNLAQKYSAQGGDMGSFLDAAKIRNMSQNSSNRELAPEELDALSAQGIELAPGSTIANARIAISLKNSGISAQRANIYANDPNREINALLKQQKLEGKEIRPLNAEQLNTINEIDSLSSFVDNVKERYIPYISENRGERFLEASLNPNSAAARLKSELDLVATQLAAAYNGKRLSDLDFKTMSKLVQPSDLDTMETVIDRLNRLKEMTELRRTGLLNTLETGQFNVSNFKIPRAGSAANAEISPDATTLPPLTNYGSAPGPASTGVPKNSDGSPLTKEQFMALRNGGQ